VAGPIQLHLEGRSIRQIATALKVDRGVIERLLAPYRPTADGGRHERATFRD
jgi:hypothetical protein